MNDWLGGGGGGGGGVKDRIVLGNLGFKGCEGEGEE